MKEEDKYYKPELDEIYTAPDLFYTGEGLFSDKILINPFLYRSKEVSFDLRDVLNLNIVLVKYLDIKDIEELGFTVEEDKEYPGEYYFSKDKSIIGKFLTTDGTYTIEIFSTFFIIKNKFELKRLLVQLALL